MLPATCGSSEIPMAAGWAMSLRPVAVALIGRTEAGKLASNPQRLCLLVTVLMKPLSSLLIARRTENAMLRAWRLTLLVAVFALAGIAAPMRSAQMASVIVTKGHARCTDKVASRTMIATGTRVAHAHFMTATRHGLALIAIWMMM